MCRYFKYLQYIVHKVDFEVSTELATGDVVSRRH